MVLLVFAQMLLTCEVHFISYASSTPKYLINQSINQMLYLKRVTQLAQGYSSLRPSLNIHVKAIHCLNKIHKKNNDKNKTHIIIYIVHIISVRSY